MNALPHSRLARTLAAVLLAPTLLSTAVGQAYGPGDLILHTPAAFGLSSTSGAIVRIDPVSGATSVITTLAATQSRGGAVAYDPFRAGLVTCATLGTPLDPIDTWVFDSAGSPRSLGYPGVSIHALAPTGDGRIYHRLVNAPPGQIHWFDDADARHALLDASGTQTFTLEFGGIPVQIRYLLHEPGTDSLIAATNSNQPRCSSAGSGSSNGVMLYRIPLSTDGTRVAGPVLCAEFEVSTSGEAPTGLSLAPGGNVLLTVDTNSGFAEPRMVLLDPVSMLATTFAINGPYLGAGTTNAGTYSNVRGQAVNLDSFNDLLRAFSAGTAGGSGTAFTASGSPISTNGASGEVATLVEVGTPTCAGRYERYGTGLRGTGNRTPTITAEGCPTAFGGTLELRLVDAAANAPAVLLVGAARASFPFLGGTVLVTPFVSAGLATDALGRATLPLTLGAPATFDFQWLVVDAAPTNQGLAMSVGLEVTVAP